jgi:hypothetical protein
METIVSRMRSIFLIAHLRSLNFPHPANYKLRSNIGQISALVCLAILFNYRIIRIFGLIISTVKTIVLILTIEIKELEGECIYACRTIKSAKNSGG